jgi:hypothetical protein
MCYVPRLQTKFQVIRFLLDHGFPIPSPVVLGRIGSDYVAAIERFIVDHEIPVVRFVKGDVMRSWPRWYLQQPQGRKAPQGVSSGRPSPASRSEGTRGHAQRPEGTPRERGSHPDCDYPPTRCSAV